MDCFCCGSPAARLPPAACPNSITDNIFALLSEAASYPAERIQVSGPVVDTLRAQAVYREKTGDPRRAAETYNEILSRVMVSNPNPQTDLHAAYGLSRLMAELARLYRKTGRADESDRLTRERQELWRHWQTQHPDSAFLREQLKAADL